MSSVPLNIINDSSLKFLLLFSNADAFYIMARVGLYYGWMSPGLVNAHQAIELYIKAILSLKHISAKKSHNIVKLLLEHQTEERYFHEIINDEELKNFLNNLTKTYLEFRYGEVGTESFAIPIITILDRLAYNLRSIYLKNINSPSRKIYMHDTVKHIFLDRNEYFQEGDLTSNIISRLGLPIEVE